MSYLLQDTTFWVLLSTVLFLFVGYKKGAAPILKILDERTERIKTELEEAEALRVEAQNVLASFEQKHRDAVKTADEIVKSATERAAFMERELKDKMTAELAQKEARLLKRIERAEQAAVLEIRTKAADVATSTVKTILVDKIAAKDKDLIKEALSSLPEKIKRAS